jgi:hypothetical protein
MPNRSNRRGRSRRGGSGGRSANNNLLKRIEENTRVELDNPVPEIPDKLPMRLKQNKVTTFKRIGLGPSINTSTSSSTFGATSFTLALFDTGAEIKATFQEYRIIELNLNFIPIMNVFTSGTPSINTGNTHTVIDYQNASVPLGFSQLDEYKTCMIVQTGKFFKRTFSPRLLSYIYGGGTPAYSSVSCMTWLSTEYNDGEYYGLKWGVGTNVGLGNIQMYTMEVEAVIQCRTPR